MKKIEIISGVCFIAGLLIIVGTAGASDLDMIDADAMVIQCGIGLLTMLIGRFGLCLSSE